MTDRELLELAAKAIGAEYRKHALGGMYLAWPPNWNGIRWNPLSDDGDAVELAKKLGFDKADVAQEISKWASWAPEKYWRSTSRYCIVRAAAEIGKAMP